MRLKHVKGALEYVTNSEYVVKNGDKPFCNDLEVHLEIGTGKGTFIYEMAKANPNINYIGAEKFESVLIKAIEKQEKEPLPNLKYLHIDAIDLAKYYNNCFSHIYLNFSDPWPKTRHDKRRLTHKNFLDVYKAILLENGQLTFKTDNTKLFEYSVTSLNNYGLHFNHLVIDLHNSIYNEGNVQTEYEVKFSSKGEKIKLINVTF